MHIGLGDLGMEE